MEADSRSALNSVQKISRYCRTPGGCSASLKLTINDEEFLVSVPITGQSSRVFIDSRAADIAQRATRYNGHYELVFNVGVVNWGCCTQRNLMIILSFPWGTQHYLGPLSSERVPSARLIATVPTFVDVHVQEDQCIDLSKEAPWPCEMLLKEHVRIILECDEVCGSMSSSHLQNLVRDLPFYSTGMRRFPNWNDFVRFFSNHYGTWKILTASGGGVSSEVHDDLRIVANAFAESCKVGDYYRNKNKLRALGEFKALVKLDIPTWKTEGVSTPFFMPKHNLKQLGQSRSFRTLNCINYVHALKSVSVGHQVLFSPSHPLQIDHRINQPGVAAAAPSQLMLTA